MQRRDAIRMTQAELIGDLRSDVAAVHGEPLVAQLRHEIHETIGDTDRSERLGGLRAEAVAGDARDHQLEAVGEKRNGAQESHEAIGPAVHEQQGRGTGRASPHRMDAVDGDVGEGVELTLHGAPVVLLGPVVEHAAESRRRDALRPVGDRGIRPPRRPQSRAQVIEVGLRNIDHEWCDGHAPIVHRSPDSRGRAGFATALRAYSTSPALGGWVSIRASRYSTSELASRIV